MLAVSSAMLAAVVVVASLDRSCFDQEPSASNASASNASAFASASAPATDTGGRPSKTFEELYRQLICENQRSCHLIANASHADRTLATRSCMCDERCNVYGDCCFDSRFYVESAQRSNSKMFHCPKEEWYMKASCVEQYADADVIGKCAEGVNAAGGDLRLVAPITDVDRNVTYANVFCAICDNRDPKKDRFRLWNVSFSCETNATGGAFSEPATDGADAADAYVANANAVAANVSWDSTLGEYRAYHAGDAYKCRARRQPPTDLVSSLRRCVPVVATCPGGADAELAARCESFALFVHDEVASYRNVFCAQCNNVTRPISGCKPQLIEDRFSTSQRLFSLGNKATGNAACSDPNVNPDLKMRFCRPS